MKRFRVKTEFKNKSARHRYFSTVEGAENHILGTLEEADRNFSKVHLYDDTRRNEWGRLIHQGHVGQIGGFLVRSSIMAIAKTLQSETIADYFGLHAVEWKSHKPIKRME